MHDGVERAVVLCRNTHTQTCDVRPAPHHGTELSYARDRSHRPRTFAFAPLHGSWKTTKKTCARKGMHAIGRGAANISRGVLLHGELYSATRPNNPDPWCYHASRAFLRESVSGRHVSLKLKKPPKYRWNVIRSCFTSLFLFYYGGP